MLGGKCRKDLLPMIDILNLDSRDIQTIPNRFDRKPRAVFDPVESFFFDCTYQHAIFDNGRRRVTVIGVDAQYYH